ncbi:MAG: hypothetical protein WC867_08150 [Candidatus Pacearchaeota archaeon]|jgi:thymidylate synthase
MVNVTNQDYYKRLVEYPTSNGSINQLEVITNKIAADPITRRAVATTRVPEIDLYRNEPNRLEEIQLRGYVENGDLILNMYSNWGSDEYDIEEMDQLHDMLVKRVDQKIGLNVKKGALRSESLGFDTEMRGESKIPSFRITGKNIPEAYWKEIYKVENSGYELRTQYDRVNSKGEYIDPLGKDSRAIVLITEPLSEPRYPVLSFSERGKYIAEFLGVKNHLVVPYEVLINCINKNEKVPTEWPYLYHGRMAETRKDDGTKFNQLERMLDILSENSFSLNAIASTRVPEIDLFLKEDLPCLGQIQLIVENHFNEEIKLNMIARWRSRAGFSAWGDNLIGITNLFQRLGEGLETRIGKKVNLGYYVESNGSLHTYGLDKIKNGLNNFFTTYPTVDSFVSKAWTSEDAKDLVIMNDLMMLKGESTWNFPPESIKLIEQIEEDFSSGKFKP